MELKEISLPIRPKDTRIDENKQYLIGFKHQKNDGLFFYAGTVTMQWYGWNFDCVYDAGCQYNYPGLKKVWEIVQE